jgi:CHRD domain
MHRSGVSLVCLLVVLCGCQQRSTATSATSTEPTQTTQTTAAATASSSPQPTPALDASRAREIGLVAEAFLSPHQESNEEQNTPSSVPKQFRATTPSMTRDQRDAAGHRAHGQIRFSKDLSRAWVDVRVEGVDLANVNMFHIHCGKPGILGPIIVDFALATDVKENLSDGMFSVELTNDHIAKTVAQGEGHGLVEGFTRGCVIGGPSLESFKSAKVMTIAGLADLAVSRDLYFNLHTTGQTYYGDIRGQLYPVENNASNTQ